MSLPPNAFSEESFEYNCSPEPEPADRQNSQDVFDEEQLSLEEVLCAERVGQMTKTYNDIDAVTRLLEEKERDLELAARIGQSLLKKNKTLTERNEYLEEQVEHIREEVSQLRHELSMKDELLQFYTTAAEESDADSACCTPIRRNESTSSVQNYFPLDSLQKKLKDLEEENIVLRSEACHLKTETITYEEKEQQLVNDCVKELRDANIQISSIAEELAKKTEDAARQQEEITHLLSQIVDLQKKSKSYAVENEELTQHLGAAKDAQRQLTAELRELEDKYAECMEMLHEAQEELKNLRNKTVPSSTPRRFHALGLFPMDSLAAEIEGTMRKELHMEDPEMEEHKLHHKRVFETVKNINQTAKQRSLLPSPMNIPGSNQSSALSSCRSTPRSSFYGSDVSNIVIDNRTNSIILETESPEGSSDGDANKKPGTPGTPGSRDLEVALRRLSLRRENYLSERRFFEEERERKLRDLADGGELHSGSLTPAESIMSLGTHHSGLSVFSFGSRSYLPEKLQIVKPLEGSATLHHWQQLAQPNLGGILDSRPGVVTKGFRPLELDLEEVYQFTDFEEDEPGDLSFQSLSTSSPAPPHAEASGERPRGPRVTGTDSGAPPSQPPPTATETPEQKAAGDEASVHYPGKCMSHTNSTYTFTTCRILHPSDELTRVTPSLSSGPMPATVCMSSLKSTPVGTPCTPRRLSLAESFTNLRDSTKTTSTSLGLVRLLQERGISAAVYNPQSWDRAATGAGTLTGPPRAPETLPSTPPNSPTTAAAATATTTTSEQPQQQQPGSSAPFEFKGPGGPYDNFLASKPASSILKEVRAESRSTCSSGSQTDVSVSNLNLLDKLKPFVPAGLAREGLALGCPGVTHAIGGIRRNRSYPAVVGASMQMKGPGPQSSELILGPQLPKQTSLK
ncbi:trafficking kinesin-binding protein 1 isoform X3 [Lepisosteus oculatus]|uniref:trafficking kinesin-binding protein 1 isoform X3 n=1 Tax=Lepisosteus oculatus TaxID=7918 RepID=UPI0035F50299